MKQNRRLGRFISVAVFLLLIPFSAFGLGQQEPTVASFPDTDVSFAYIPGQAFEISSSLEIGQFSANDQDYFIVLDYGQNQGSCGGGPYARCVADPTNPSDTVSYELRNDNGNVIRDLADAGTSSQVISGVAPGNPGGLNWSLFSAAFSIFVEAGQLQNPDPAYEDNLTMRFYYGSVEDPASYDAANPDATATLTVLGNVAPFIEVLLVNPGGPVPLFGGTTQQTMDFGVLQPGATRAYDLLVETNALFTMTISSTNGGVLTYQGGTAPNGLPTEVEYRLYVDSQEVNLSGGAAVFGSGLSGFRWPFVVEILDYGVPVAGDYEDVIDITVSTDQ